MNFFFSLLSASNNELRSMLSLRYKRCLSWLQSKSLRWIRGGWLSVFRRSDRYWISYSGWELMQGLDPMPSHTSYASLSPSFAKRQVQRSKLGAAVSLGNKLNRSSFPLSEHLMLEMSGWYLDCYVAGTKGKSFPLKMPSPPTSISEGGYRVKEEVLWILKGRE